MKAKGCLVTTLLFAATTVDAQQQPFLTYSDSASWSIAHALMGVPQGAYVANYTGTISLCGQQYSVMPAGGGLWYGPGYFRNEGQRVLFRTSEDCLEPERVIYDFSASIGDTLEIGMSEMDNFTRMFVVDDIDTIATVGGLRRRFKMLFSLPFNDPIEPFYLQMHWLEGIGSTTHPFFPLICLDGGCESSWALTCADSLGSPVFRIWTGVTCHENVGVQDSMLGNSDGFTITVATGLFVPHYPNDFGKGDVRIIDASGKTCLQQRVSSTTASFAVPSLPLGLYWVVLNDSDGQRWATHWLSAP